MTISTIIDNRFIINQKKLYYFLSSMPQINKYFPLLFVYEINFMKNRLEI